MSPVFVDKSSTARFLFPTYQEILNRTTWRLGSGSRWSISTKTRRRLIRPCDIAIRLDLPSCPACGVLKSFSSLRANRWTCRSLACALSRGHHQDDPVGVYALASKYRYEDVSSVAARACLNHPLSRLTSPQLPSVTTGKYRQLIRYRSSCGGAAIAVTLQREWLSSWYESLLTWHLCLGEDSTCCKTRDNAQDRPRSDPKSSALRSPPRYLGIPVELFVSLSSHSRVSPECGSSNG